MRLPDHAHTTRPWRIHEMTQDFEVEDVWSLPTPGGPHDFPQLVRAIVSGDPTQSASPLARALWTLRLKIGSLLGWDDADAGIDTRVATLRDRLPADLQDGPRGPEFRELPFRPLYLTEDEFAAEIANRTMHGVLHLSWVPDEATGQFRGQLAVLVKPNGALGAAYMAAIKPFRHLIVYPGWIRTLAKSWRPSAGDPETDRDRSSGSMARPGDQA